MPFIVAQYTATTNLSNGGFMKKINAITPATPYSQRLAAYYASLKQTSKLPFSMEHLEVLLTLPHPMRERAVVKYMLESGSALSGIVARKAA